VSSPSESAVSPRIEAGAEAPGVTPPERVGRGVTRNPDNRLARIGGAGVVTAAEVGPAVGVGLGADMSLTGLLERARAALLAGDGARVSGTEDGVRSDTALRPRRLTAVGRGKWTGVGVDDVEGREEGPAREAAAELKTLGLDAAVAGGRRR
jgi:hypothetical protein